MSKVINHSVTTHKKLSKIFTLPEREVMDGKTKKTKKAEEVSIFTGPGGEFVPALDTHYQFEEFDKSIAADINEGAPVLLVGHTGTGKTSRIMQMAARSGHQVLRVNLNNQMTISDFVGYQQMLNGNMSFVDGALTQAVKNGYWLVVDGLDFAEAGILATLNGLLEKRGKLILKENKGEVIEPHANFRLFATANTMGCMEPFRYLYQGTNQMNDAFLDRWRCYKIDYLSPERELEYVLNVTFPDKNLSDPEDRKKAIRILGPLVKVAASARKLFVDGNLGFAFSTRRLLDWCSLTYREKSPNFGAEIAIFSKVSQDDADKIRTLMEQNITDKGQG